MNLDNPTNTARHIVIHTDGACIGNPGPGGWAAVMELRDGDTVVKKKHLAGREKETTNNRMELIAAIKALGSLNSSHPVTIWSDSEYVVKGMSEWLHGWKANGWRTSSKKPVKNADLWQALDAACEDRKVGWQWVRGHSGHPLNEEADRLAHVQARKAA